ncbi:MAG: FxLYD domain-containing protein [Candidatus Dormibacteraeota bacterium]|nr:FxLYD domain-containing protein [Candidatus Dormibacteraeota bacterium]
MRGTRGPTPRLLALLGAASLALLAGACSAPFLSSGPTPAEMSAAALKSVLSADNLRYTGSTQLSGVDYTLDATINQKGDSRSTLNFLGAQVEVLQAGANIFRKAPASYWHGLGADAPTQRVYASGWVKTGGGAEEAVLTALSGAEVERDLNAHFRPSKSAAASVAGTHALKLSGTEGDLYVTASKPFKALSFASAASYVSPSRLSRIKFTYSYPVPLDLTPPAAFINPDDHATWPAFYEVTTHDQGACGDTSCEFKITLRNTGGAPSGQATVTVSVQDSAGKDLGSCTANIPPAPNGQTVTVSCAVSGPAWAAFSANGGSYFSRATVNNPAYDG